MKASYRLFALATLFAISVACWSGLGSSSAQEKGKEAQKGKGGGGVAFAPVPLPKWEYMVKTFEGKDNKSFEKELNEVGEEGWELGGVMNTVTNGASSPPRLIFKRARR